MALVVLPRLHLRLRLLPLLLDRGACVARVPVAVPVAVPDGPVVVVLVAVDLAAAWVASNLVPGMGS